MAQAANLKDAQVYSGHSLRGGFATSASQRGAAFLAIKRQGRWKSDATVRGYMEAGQKFQDNAVGVFLSD